MKYLLLAGIWLYRRVLSPYKGFACAVRVTHGGESCSAYGRRVIARFGAGTGLELLRRRLAHCGTVSRRTAYTGTLLRRQRGDCDMADCDMADCDMADCNMADCGCSPCDLVQFDCGNPARWRKSKLPPHLRVKSPRRRK